MLQTTNQLWDVYGIFLGGIDGTIAKISWDCPLNF